MITSKLVYLILFGVGLSQMSCKEAEKNKLKEEVVTEEVEKKRAKNISEAILVNPKVDSSRLTGIGIFKIGSSIDNTIGELVRSKLYTRTTIRNYKQQSDYELSFYTSKKKVIAEIFPENPLETDKSLLIINAPSIWCRNSKIFLINHYVVDKISLNKVVLTYYKGRLVAFVCDYSEKVENALIAKYGKPDRDIILEGSPASKIWYNGDVEIEAARNLYIRAWINGSFSFIDKCSDKDFEEESDAKRKLLKGSLNNL